MKVLDEEKLLVFDIMKDLVKNDLVFIFFVDSSVLGMKDLIIDKVKKIVVGEVESVLVGKYVDEVLINLNLKDKLKDKLVFVKDVKEVLVWV